MAEELKTNLANYKLQLQQVEAALTTDSTNEDLVKLKKDLQEVVQLTQDLIQNQDVASAALSSTSGEASSSVAQPLHDWKPGDHCLAVWSGDQQWYEAVIDEILEDGSCTVTFQEYGNIDVTQVSQLRSLDEDGNAEGEGQDGSNLKKSKKDMIAAQREYKKKKAQKKKQRQKQMEEQKEGEKAKWLTFNAKLFSKTNKGKVKKSIFATPDNVHGRVGVGTCGVGGRPMTSYSQPDKWKKQA